MALFALGGLTCSLLQWIMTKKVTKCELCKYPFKLSKGIYPLQQGIKDSVRSTDAITRTAQTIHSTSPRTITQKRHYISPLSPRLFHMVRSSPFPRTLDMALLFPFRRLVCHDPREEPSAHQHYHRNHQ